MSRLISPLGLLQRRRRRILLTAPSYAEEVLADEPLAYWRLGASPLVDASGNGRDLTQAGDGGVEVDGLIVGEDKAREFAYISGDYYSIADAAWMDQQSYSIEAWIKLSSVNDHQTIFARGLAFPWSFVINNDFDEIQFVHKDAAGTVSIAFISPAPFDAIVHLVGTYDASTETQRFYVDGELHQSNTEALPPAADNSDDIFIATRSDTSTLTASGVLDEVAIYDHALSAERVLAHYNAGVGA